jgi:ubiquinone/menaquinone biosynthesis C-methylase UbiE
MSGGLAVALVLLAAAAWFAWQRRHPAPFPPWLTPILDTPLRRRIFSPAAAAERHGIAPGMRVLEVGPGAGYLTGEARDCVGPSGALVCLDLQLAMLKKLRRTLAPRALALVGASGSALPFRAGAFDLVFLVHVLGEIPDRAGALRELARVLRPGGILAVTEGLPDPDFVSRSRLLRMAGEAGFAPAERFGGRLHYTQRFRRP